MAKEIDSWLASKAADDQLGVVDGVDLDSHLDVFHAILKQVAAALRANSSDVSDWTRPTRAGHKRTGPRGNGPTRTRSDPQGLDTQGLDAQGQGVTHKEVCGGAKIFGSALLQPARSVCVSLSAFFHCVM